MDVASLEHASFIERGWQALAQGSWDDARVKFAAVAETDPSAEVYEGLGWAASWLNDIGLSFSAWETSHRLFNERGDRLGAARTAMYLSTNYFIRRGEHAVANGWLQRSYRLLEGLDPAPEHAMIIVWDAYGAILLDHDPARAKSLSIQAAALARQLGVIDVEVLARATEGYARVLEGEIEAGMRLLDEATAAAVSGDMTDLDSMTVTCCFLIFACERVGDFERASQWCKTLMAISTRWSYHAMFSFCRTHLAGVMMWRGEWDAAESQLMSACEELETSYPAMAFEGVLRLADLRRKQGRFDEAAELFAQAERDPIRMLGSKIAVLGRAWLAFDLGDPGQAIDLAERYLRSLPGGESLEQVTALELLVRSHADQGDLERATQALERLQHITSGLSSPSLRAAASAGGGVLSQAGGDLESARQQFEDAVDLYAQSGAPFEVARARLELAEVLLALGRSNAALREVQPAFESLVEIGASHEATKAQQMLSRLHYRGRDSGQKPADTPNLTNREREVLGLVAQGLSDREMAVKLGLSEHTIHRHVANILDKFSSPSRAAAVALAAKHNLL